MNELKSHDADRRKRIEAAIAERFEHPDERDSEGRAIVALPASDKLGLAKQADVDFAELDSYLGELCVEVRTDERRAAVPAVSSG